MLLLPNHGPEVYWLSRPGGAPARRGGRGRPGCRGAAAGRLANLHRVMTGLPALSTRRRTAPRLWPRARIFMWRGWSAGMPVGPGVDDVEHGVHGLGGHEAALLLNDRVHDGVQPVLGEGLEVVLGLPDVDVAQPAVDAQGQVGDQAVRVFGAQARPDAGVGLGVDRHVVGECVGHRSLLYISPN